MKGPRKYILVLAIYPSTRGFAFVLFEGHLAPVDWGSYETYGEHKNRECLRRISQIFGRYAPDALVLQDMSAEGGTRRAARICELNEAIQVLADTQGIPIFAYSREQVRDCFRQFGAITKQHIAEAIGTHIPALEPRVPPKRKLWTSETARMALFDAAALGLTFYHAEG